MLLFISAPRYVHGRPAFRRRDIHTSGGLSRVETGLRRISRMGNLIYTPYSHEGMRILIFKNKFYGCLIVFLF